MSCWISCCSSREGYIGNIEYWDLWWKVLQKLRIFFLTKNFLSESQYPEAVKTNQKNVQDSHWRGTWVNLAVPEVVRKQSSDILILVWRFCAFQVICLFSRKSHLCPFQWQLGCINSDGFFGVWFCLIWSNIPKDLKLLQRVPIGTSYQHRVTRRDEVGVPGAVQKGRKGFCHHHKWCKAGRKGFNLDCAEDLDPVVSIYRPGACSAKPGQCIILFTIKLSFIWKPGLDCPFKKEKKKIWTRKASGKWKIPWGPFQKWNFPAEVEESGWSYIDCSGVRKSFGEEGRRNG